MDRKKRRRSVRNLRRQSINSISGDTDTELPPLVSDDSSVPAVGDTDIVFGTVWVETEEESLREKRKRRRSSMLLQRPLINLDTTSLEIEAMREDVTEKSPALVRVSPDVINSLVTKIQSPILTTPDLAPHSLTPNNLDVGFLGVGDTSMKKVYPVTPDVETDILCDTTPYMNTSDRELTSSIKKVYPVTPDVDEDVLALDSPVLSDSPFITPLTSRKNHPNGSVIDDGTPSKYLTVESSVKLMDSYTSQIIGNYNCSLDNQSSMDEQIETGLSSACNNSFKFETIVKTPGVDNSSENKPVAEISPVTSSQLISPDHVTLSSLSDTVGQGELSGNHDNKDVGNTRTEAKNQSSESGVTKLISPTGIAEGLDNLATGALGLFNTLVHKISIKRRKSQKKTPKRLKSDKNAENLEKSQHSNMASLMEEAHRVNNGGNADNIGNKIGEMVETVEGDDMIMDTGVGFTATQPSDGENVKTVSDKHSASNDITDSSDKPSSCKDISTLSDKTSASNDNKISSDNTMETQDQNEDNFNMSSLAESIESEKENAMKTKRRSRRTSTEFFMNSDLRDSTVNEGEEGIKETNKEDEEETNMRRSRRQRRASLDIYQSGMEYQSQIPEVLNTQFVKLTRPKKKAHENLEDLYMNKNYKAPAEKTWETIYESPGKTRQPNQIMSKKRLRRVIDFDGFAPAKFRRRLQKASNNGWDMTGKKHKILNDDFVKNKLSEIYVYLDNS